MRGALRKAVDETGCRSRQDIDGPKTGRLGAAGWDKEDVIRFQRNIGTFACEDLLEIDWYFVPIIATRNSSHDLCPVTRRRLLEPFGEGEYLEGAAGAIVIKRVATGFFDGADDINNIRPRNADDVIGLDVDVLGWVTSCHNALDTNGGNRVTASRIKSGSRQRNRSPLDLPGDDDGVPRISAESARERENFEESLLALKLMNSRCCDRTEDRHALAVHFHH